MSVNNFDITTLLEFTPPSVFCKNCFALLSEANINRYSESKQVYSAKCPFCSVEYLPTDEFPLSEYYPFQSLVKYLHSESLKIEYKDLIEHGRTLARIVRHGQKYLNTKPSHNGGIWSGYHLLRALLSLLKSARYFVHFMTYGSISHQLIGALKMVALDIPVRGIVSNIREGDEDELSQKGEEAPRLNVKVYKTEADGSDMLQTSPHQKILIIDGLVAIKGSANFTLSGYRKAAKRHELLEFVTDIKQVVELNNKYFSSVWGSLSEKEAIEMNDLPF